MQVDMQLLPHYYQAFGTTLVMEDFATGIKPKDAPIPQYQTSGAAAIDLHACITTEKHLKPGEHMLVPSGIKLNIANPNLVFLLYARSGNGVKYGIQLRNGTGVVDSDYQGEVMIPLVNTGNKVFIIKPFARIAQGIFTQIDQVKLNLVKKFDTNTERGEKGFGSTGS